MKKSGLVAASVAAASVVSASSSTKFHFPHQQDVCPRKSNENSKSNGSDKFAPRFDGLRFIETLVTAHR